MFFIGIFGVDMQATPLGVTAPKTCPRCHNAVPWTILETSRRFSLFFIPVFTWGRAYHVSCPICGESLPLRSHDEALGMRGGEYTGDD